MNTAALLFYIGRILIVEALAMIPSMTISLLNGEDMSWRAFIVTIATLAVIGLAISLPVSKKTVSFIPVRVLLLLRYHGYSYQYLAQCRSFFHGKSRLI